jgi:sec-independent protein translocase protein TatA
VPFNVGPMELLIVLALALIVLGPKRLPEAGKAIGRSMREFKGAISPGVVEDDS